MAIDVSVGSWTPTGQLVARYHPVITPRGFSRPVLSRSVALLASLGAVSCTQRAGMTVLLVIFRELVREPPRDLNPQTYGLRNPATSAALAVELLDRERFQVDVV